MPAIVVSYKNHHRFRETDSMPYAHVAGPTRDSFKVASPQEMSLSAFFHHAETWLQERLNAQGDMRRGKLEVQLLGFASSRYLTGQSRQGAAAMPKRAYEGLGKALADAIDVYKSQTTTSNGPARESGATIVAELETQMQQWLGTTPENKRLR